MITTAVTTTIRPPAPTAAALARQLRAEGFTPGLAGLSAQALAIDLRAYGRMRCPGCRRRMRVRPWTDGARCRLLCTCGRCKLGQEA